jgi:class 3 adenylate cyclase/tetratricopeptide (TPR) repeat protein
MDEALAEREQLERAIAHLEAQRAVLGNAAVEAALAGLRQKLATLGQGEGQGLHEPAASTIAGERKFVTVMFADISGFTALAEKIDPESVRDLMNACFEQLVPIIEKYRGTVDKFIGDGVMALFGAPVTHEQDPELALHAALEMTEALAAFNAEHGLDFGLHFGINSGLVIAGGIGTGERQEYSVIGDTVNLASRLGDYSERGQILVGPETYRLTNFLFEFETVKPIRVKGKTEPVQAYRVLGLRGKSTRVRWLATQGITSPLVGRDAEFAAINGCVERLLNGQGSLLSVIGEAGVGKSRLMAEVRNRIVGVSSHSPVQWLEGRTLSYGQTISYWPFQEILWQYAGITEDDSEVDAWHRLESRILTLFAENTAEVLPYLASLLTLEVKGEYTARVKYLDSEAMRRQLFLVSRRFFEQLAQTKPLVLVFEDLHWGDESSALLLEHLLPLVERVPLLICGISRPDPRTPAARLREIMAQDYTNRYTEIRLAPLSPDDSAQLMHNLLKRETLPSRVREVIVRKAEGNPFFLEEIVRSLIDTGAVVRDPTTGRWQTTAQVETVTIPDTVQGVIMARVDRLDEDVRRVLRMAAVIGRSFLYRVLRAIADTDRGLDQHLTELQVAELIREKQRLPELEYIFKHALAQEATYESVLLQKRRELHARVGQAIETLFANRLEEFYNLLAYHYAQAEVWERAHDYLLKTGDQAGRIAADAEALAHYQQAMIAYERAFGPRWKPLQRASLEHKMGEAFFRRGEHEQAMEYLQRALTYLGNPLPKSCWGVRLAILREIAQQVSHRLLPRLFLKPVGKPVSPALEEEIRLYEFIGWIDAFGNNERFLLIALRALNVSECNGFSYGVATACMALGTTCNFVSTFWLAKVHHRRAMALAEQIQHPGAVGLAYTGWTVHNMCLGDWDAATEYGQRTARIYQENGNLHGWGYAAYMVTVALAYQGEFTQALTRCRDIVRFGREGADHQVLCWGLTTQGFIQYRLGQLDEAFTVLQEACELAERARDWVFRTWAGNELGRCDLRRGQLEQALTTLEMSQQFYIEHPTKAMVWLPFRSGLPEAYMLAVEQSTESEKQNWLQKARCACRDALNHGKAYRGVMPEAMRLQGTYEWLRGKSTSARKWWQRSLALAEEMGQRYDLAMTHLEIGQRLGERAHLERAETIFSEIDAEWDLVQARDALGSIETA